MNKPYNITLDLYQCAQSVPGICYISGDQNTMPLTLELRDKGEPVTLTDTTQALLTFETREATFPRSARVNAAAGVVEYDVLLEDIAVPGNVSVAVTLLDGDRQLTWAGFIFRVLEAPGGGDPLDPWQPWVIEITTKIDDHETRIEALEQGGGGVPGPPGPQGEPGQDGAPGEKGEPGAGVPAGGTAGQILAKVSDNDFDTAWIDPPHTSGARVLYFDRQDGAPVLTSERPMANTVILPKTYFGANPEQWTAIMTTTAAADIADEEIEITTEDRFAAKIYLLSDMAKSAKMRIQAVDTRDGTVIASDTIDVSLPSDGNTPYPLAFDDFYQVLRTITHGDIATTLYVNPDTYGVQIGVISYPPNSVSYINTATAGGMVSRTEFEALKTIVMEMVT